MLRHSIPRSHWRSRGAEPPSGFAARPAPAATRSRPRSARRAVFVDMLYPLPGERELSGGLADGVDASPAPPPGLHAIRGPGGGTVGVAFVARVGRAVAAEPQGQPRVGNVAHRMRPRPLRDAGRDVHDAVRHVAVVAVRAG